MLVFATYFLITVLGISTVTFLEKNNPHKTLAWILIILILPFIGFLLYLLIGHSFLQDSKYHHYKNWNSSLKKFNKQTTIEHAEYARLSRLVNRTAQAPLTVHNSCQVYFNGQDAFTNMLWSLKNAQKHIYLEFYIYRDDQIGNKIKKILIEKALAGLQVRFLYDGLGSRKLKKNFINELEQAGVQTACFAPFSFPWLSNHLNYRNHRKIMVIDGQIGYLGGMNVGDEYLSQSNKFDYWRDCQLCLKGEAVHYLQQVFRLDWSYITGEQFTDPEYYPNIKEVKQQIPVQIVADGPYAQKKPIMQMYLSLLATAKKNIYLTTPYFIPNEGIMLTLENAALGGLDVRILIPGKTTQPLVMAASMSYLGKLLQAGVKVYQYQKGFVHAKTLVIDSQITSIGTANMDMRSFNLNFEINALIYDTSLTRLMEEAFINDLKNSQEVDYDLYQQRSISTKLLESTGQLFSPLL